MEWHIPEVSSSETELAFESFDLVRSIVEEDDPLKRFLGYERVDRHLKAITYGDDLYRRLSHDGEDISTMFSQAFPAGWEHDSGVGVGGDISYPGFSFETSEERKNRPISLPVFRQLRWNIMSSSSKDTILQNQEIWPQSIASPENENGMYQKRNHVTFDEVLPKIVEYNHEQLETCMRTHAAHMANFLLVDGELWMKTKPPVYVVARHYNSREKASATISMVFAPDWHDTRLTRAYFSLGDRDEAIAYAHALCDALSERKIVSWVLQDGELVKSQLNAIRGDVSDFSSRHVVHCPTISDYSCHEEELRRLSFGLAVESNRFVARNPKWKEKFGDDAVRAVVQSFAEVMETNYVLGEFGDASEQLASNATVWKRSRRGRSTYDFGEVGVADLLIERALGYEENKPINMRAIHRSDLGRTI
jgi:hypothetical protein